MNANKPNQANKQLIGNRTTFDKAATPKTFTTSKDINDMYPNGNTYKRRKGNSIFIILVTHYGGSENNSFKANGTRFNYTKDIWPDKNYFYTNPQKPKQYFKDLQIERTQEFSFTHNNPNRVILITKIKLVEGERFIEVGQFDNVFTKAFQFCYANNLDYRFVNPIGTQIIKAINEMNRILDSEIDYDDLKKILG
jgi:hypothetical protein